MTNPSSPPLPPKALSVDAKGAPDGFQPPSAWYAEVLPGGYSRLVVSLPGERVEAVHRDLIAAMRGPLQVLYVQLTDRREGQLSTPRRLVGLEHPTEVVLAALAEVRALVYHDGRHQLWVRGSLREQVVLEEIGVLYCYPDDPSFRDVLEAHGLPERKVQTMAERDYVRVAFLAEADADEAGLVAGLGLRPWSG
jgi:hypothetical protein